MAVLAGAGWNIVGQVREFLAGPIIERIPEPLFDRANNSVEVAKIKVEKAGGREVVSLSRAHPRVEGPPNRSPGPLVRELFRQTLLIAARDGLEAGIRDEVLDKPATGPSTSDLELQAEFLAGDKASLSIRKAGGSDVVWSADLAVPSDDLFRLPEFVEEIEPLSRGELVEALKKEGMTPAAPASSKSGQVPEEAARALERLTFVSQYSAIRSLSGAARAGGSAEQLGALARAYANLGVLTEHHWSPAHKALDARALLYSQRLVALHPDSPWSYWNRAYVRGVVGLHRDAVLDLEEAASRLEKIPAGRRPTPPAWAPLVKQLCEFDTQGLMAKSEDPALAPLASIFALMTVEDSTAMNRAIRVARLAQRVNPDNPWVNDAAFRIRKLSHLHVVTVEGLARFDGAFSRDMAKVPGLPDGVAKQLRAKGGEVKVIKALIAAGTPDRDPAELSWAVLGRMAREARFAQVAHRVEFMATMWGVPADELIDQARPFAADHPYWPLLLTYSAHHALNPNVTLEHVSKMATREYEVSDGFFLQTVGRLVATAGNPRWASLSGSNGRNLDRVARDLTRRISPYREGVLYDDSTVEAAKLLLSISPDSPAAWTVLLRMPRDRPKVELADLEKRHAQHPEILVPLGTLYAAENRPADAERVFSAAIKVSPDHETYNALANTYKSLHKMDKWKETLDAFLSEDDPGLDHARVRVELARYFMNRREYAKAQPYAEAAAESYAAWAMQCAAECDELMGDWDKAEMWHRRQAERYPNSQIAWFYFCARTGHGDRAAAAALMDQFIAAIGEGATSSELNQIGPFYILTKRPKEALEVYRKLWAMSEKEKAPDGLFHGVQLAVLADELGEKDLCVTTLERLATAYSKPAPRMSSICRMLHDWLASPQPATLDLGPIDEILAKMGSNKPSGKADDKPWAGFGYYIGRLLEQHGRSRESLKYHGHTARCEGEPYLVRYLSYNALRDQGIKVGPNGEL